MPNRSRRRFLAGRASVLALGLLAGCREGDGSGIDTGGTTSPDASETPTTSTAPSTARTEMLDRREANVVGLAVGERNAGYRFDVTLDHDDAGEDGYANWWQVERLDGTRLGRRDPLHAHAEQPFTRSFDAGDCPR